MIADSASDLEAARLLTLSCAAALDDIGPRLARDKIASIKVTVPELTYRVVDRAIQVGAVAAASVHDCLFSFCALRNTVRYAQITGTD